MPPASPCMQLTVSACLVTLVSLTICPVESGRCQLDTGGTHANVRRRTTVMRMYRGLGAGFGNGPAGQLSRDLHVTHEKIIATKNESLSGS